MELTTARTAAQRWRIKHDRAVRLCNHLLHHSAIGRDTGLHPTPGRGRPSDRDIRRADDGGVSDRVVVEVMR